MLETLQGKQSPSKGKKNTNISKQAHLSNLVKNGMMVKFDDSQQKETQVEATKTSNNIADRFSFKSNKEYKEEAIDPEKIKLHEFVKSIGHEVDSTGHYKYNKDAKEIRTKEGNPSIDIQEILPFVRRQQKEKFGLSEDNDILDQGNYAYASHKVSEKKSDYQNQMQKKEYSKDQNSDIREMADSNYRINKFNADDLEDYKYSSDNVSEESVEPMSKSSSLKRAKERKALIAKRRADKLTAREERKAEKLQRHQKAYESNRGHSDSDNTHNVDVNKAAHHSVDPTISQHSNKESSATVADATVTSSSRDNVSQPNKQDINSNINHGHDTMDHDYNAIPSVNKYADNINANHGNSYTNATSEDQLSAANGRGRAQGSSYNRQQHDGVSSHSTSVSPGSLPNVEALYRSNDNMSPETSGQYQFNSLEGGRNSNEMFYGQPSNYGNSYLGSSQYMEPGTTAQYDYSYANNGSYKQDPWNYANNNLSSGISDCAYAYKNNLNNNDDNNTNSSFSRNNVSSNGSNLYYNDANNNNVHGDNGSYGYSGNANSSNDANVGTSNFVTKDDLTDLVKSITEELSKNNKAVDSQENQPKEESKIDPILEKLTAAIDSITNASQVIASKEEAKSKATLEPQPQYIASQPQAAAHNPYQQVNLSALSQLQSGGNGMIDQNMARVLYYLESDRYHKDQMHLEKNLDKILSKVQESNDRVLAVEAANKQAIEAANTPVSTDNSLIENSIKQAGTIIDKLNEVSKHIAEDSLENYARLYESSNQYVSSIENTVDSFSSAVSNLSGKIESLSGALDQSNGIMVEAADKSNSNQIDLQDRIEYIQQFLKSGLKQDIKNEHMGLQEAIITSGASVNSAIDNLSSKLEDMISDGSINKSNIVSIQDDLAVYRHQLNSINQAVRKGFDNEDINDKSIKDMYTNLTAKVNNLGSRVDDLHNIYIVPALKSSKPQDKGDSKVVETSNVNPLLNKVSKPALEAAESQVKGKSTEQPTQGTKKSIKDSEEIKSQPNPKPSGNILLNKIAVKK